MQLCLILRTEKLFIGLKVSQKDTINQLERPYLRSYSLNSYLLPLRSAVPQQQSLTRIRQTQRTCLLQTTQYLYVLVLLLLTKRALLSILYTILYSSTLNRIETNRTYTASYILLLYILRTFLLVLSKAATTLVIRNLK